MEKADVKAQEAQSDTSSVINMKEYAPSEYPNSEAPPAYMKPRGTAYRIARLAAFTVIASAVILGTFILAASWIQANTARNLDLTLNQELMDDLHPSYEHLVASDNLVDQQDNSVNDDNKSQELKQESQDSSQLESQSSSSQQDDQLVPQQIPQGQDGKQMELDEIANMLVQKGVRGNVNCIVEKRRNEELVDHAPRNVALPFGLNITTPPRLQHLTGEQIVIVCKDENDDKESEEKQEEPEQQQQILLPLPPQLLQHIQQIPQMIPLSQVLQHISQQQPQVQQIPQPQHTIFTPQQVQEQPLFHHGQPQPIFYPHQVPQPQQQVFYPQQQQQQQQPIFYAQQQQQQQQPQQVFYPQQQQFMPPPPPPPQQQPEEQPHMVFRPQMPFREVPQERIPMNHVVPLREVPLNQDRVPMNHVMHQRMPINPLAVQDVPLSQMPFTHMPMRAEQPVPVHHLVPPRPQNNQLETFNREEEEPMPEFRIREIPEFRGREIPEFRREMPEFRREMPPPMFRERAEAPRPLPPVGRDPRLMRLPFAPIADNALPAEAPQPPRRFRFPDSEPETATFTRIIPIRLEKDESSSSQEEKRPMSIPINAILDMVFRGMRPLMGGRQAMPIDIKIERIEKPISIETSAENSSQESREDEMENDPTAMMMEEERQDSTEQPSQPKLQEVEIVEKQGEDTHPIPIPVEAQEAQVFKLEKESFLPNGAGRGGVFPIPQDGRDAQIFTVSDARASVVNPEGEIKLLPIGGEQSIRLYPVAEEELQPTPQPTEAQPQQQAEERTETDRPHFVQPRSV